MYFQAMNYRKDVYRTKCSSIIALALNRGVSLMYPKDLPFLVESRNLP